MVSEKLGPKPTTEVSPEMPLLNHQEQFKAKEAKLKELEQAEAGSEETQRQSLESARAKIESLPPEPTPVAQPRRLPVSNAQAKQHAFASTMADVRQHLGAPGRVFSRLIHHPQIEKISDIGAKTIARPSLLLGVSVGGFVGGSIFYILAQKYGFGLSGSEFLSFGLVGGLLGLIGDALIYTLRKLLRKT